MEMVKLVFLMFKYCGFGSLISNDNLYFLDTIISFNETLHSSSSGTKHKLANDNSTML